MKRFAVVIALMGLLAAPVMAQDEGSSLPRPADGWWETVNGGESASYEMSQMGQTMLMGFKVDSRDGSMITVTRTMSVNGNDMPPQTETRDAADPDALWDGIGDGATVEETGSETVEAAGRSWDCTVYQVETEQNGMKMSVKLWHSEDLLPVFSGGTVKMEMTMTGVPGQEEGMTVTMTLTEVGGAE